MSEDQTHQMVAAMRRRAVELRDQAETLDRAADVLEGKGKVSSVDTNRLRTAGTTANMRNMDVQHRAHISAARAGANDRLTKAANLADPPCSVNSLASELKISSALLRAAHKGDRSIAESLAVRVRDRLGKDERGDWRFAATKSNWPKIRAGE